MASGASEVVVANRSLERAIALVERHFSGAGGDSKACRVAAAPLDGCGEGFDVVVNASASSVAGAPVPVAAGVVRPGGLALDMMYGPAATGFVAWAEAHGATGRDGLGMLVEQAAEAFAFWRGVAPDTAPVLRALRARLASP
jgi:shikimate dehydrogenase